MRCPFCDSAQSSVIDKRAVKSSGEIRRRRECLKCHKRYTTYERMTVIELLVIKKDGRKERFSKEKLKSGIAKALEKRQGIEQIDQLIIKIEKRLWDKGRKEIESRLIGQAVLLELKKIDKVAYLRFASVYRTFQNPGDFRKELDHLN